mgnify:CR=1 FL=1
MKTRLGRVYHDRNLLAIGFAVMVYASGGRAGWYVEDDGEWPVVWAGPPAGDLQEQQMGWHVHPELLPVLEHGRLPNRPYEYNGHDRTERNNLMINEVIIGSE